MQADRTCERRMAEFARRAWDSGIPQRSDFLTPAQQVQAEICARGAGVQISLYGGMEDAERRLAVFHTDNAKNPEISCVRIAWNARFAAPSHRDLLGSLTGLGLAREKMGDIRVQAGHAYAVVLPEILRYIEENLSRVGNTPVMVSCMEHMPEATLPEAANEVRATLASLRLDAFVGEAFHLSRTKAESCVLSGLVAVNHREELRPDAKLCEGALVSVRGMGRARLQTIHGTTRKNRTSITILVY